LKGLTELFYEPESKRMEVKEEKAEIENEQVNLFELECCLTGMLPPKAMWHMWNKIRRNSWKNL